MRSEDADAPVLDDTPLLDRLWAALGAGFRGQLALCGTALAVSATLGWPRRAAAALTGAQLAWLGAQALGTGAILGRTGWRWCRRYPGALAVAFVAGVPTALALLMGREWHDPREPLATWTRLVGDSAQLAALEAPVLGYLLWRLFHQRPPAAAEAGAGEGG